MNDISYLSTLRIVEILISKGYEGEYWDYKQEWHTNMEDLLKDIICFANTPHDKNCYLLFGVNDSGKIVGMKKARRKQADILEALDNLWFAGDKKPEIYVETIVIEGTEIDVLTVFNTENTPIYLKRKYGKMFAGCIYMRKGDKNTPDCEMADIDDVEKLWKKRFGLLQSPLDYILSRLKYPLEWKQQGDTYYNIYRPEYKLKITDDDDHKMPEFYAYAMTNESTFYEIVQIIAGNTILDEYQLVVLDSGRYRTPTPEWGYVGYDKYGLNNRITYKYFIVGSERYKLYRFFLDEENEEAIYANKELMEVVLLFETEEEREQFEAYIEDNQEKVVELAEKIDQYSYVQATNDRETKECIHRLHIGIVLNDLLHKWRDRKEYVIL